MYRSMKWEKFHIEKISDIEEVPRIDRFEVEQQTEREAPEPDDDDDFFMPDDDMLTKAGVEYYDEDGMFIG